jgi:hypothetical protein
MATLDFVGVLGHLLARMGETVEVSIGGSGETSPPFVAELVGTLRGGSEPLSEELPAIRGPVEFGFEEHESTFTLDPLTFRGARERGDYLHVALGSIAIEVRAPVDEDEEPPEPDDQS